MLTKICKIEGCNRKHNAFGLCLMHYKRQKRNGNPLTLRITPNDKAVEFIEAAVASKTDDCITWPYLLSHGYGVVTYRGRRTRAHRMALILSTGSEPENSEACHGECHNRACINPKHLRWQDRYANMADKKRDGTSNRGERNPSGKLTESQVMEIFKDSRSGTKIARDYNISPRTIRDIKSGATWGWMTSAMPRGAA